MVKWPSFPPISPKIRRHTPPLKRPNIQKMDEMICYGSDLTYEVGQLLSINDLGQDWPSLLVKWPFFLQLALKFEGVLPP